MRSGEHPRLDALEQGIARLGRLVDEAARAKEPMIRTRGWLESQGLWDEAREQAIAVDRLRAAARDRLQVGDRLRDLALHLARHAHVQADADDHPRVIAAQS